MHILIKEVGEIEEKKEERLVIWKISRTEYFTKLSLCAR